MRKVLQLAGIYAHCTQAGSEQYSLSSAPCNFPAAPAPASACRMKHRCPAQSSTGTICAAVKGCAYACGHHSRERQERVTVNRERAQSTQMVLDTHHNVSDTTVPHLQRPACSGPAAASTAALAVLSTSLKPLATSKLPRKLEQVSLIFASVSASSQNRSTVSSTSVGRDSKLRTAPLSSADLYPTNPESTKSFMHVFRSLRAGWFAACICSRLRVRTCLKRQEYCN